MLGEDTFLPCHVESAVPALSQASHYVGGSWVNIIDNPGWSDNSCDVYLYHITCTEDTCTYAVGHIQISVNMR